MLAVWVLLWRGIDRRAGVYGVVVLATTPLWFAGGPEILTATAQTVALAGGYVAVVDGRCRIAFRVVAALVAVAAVVAGGVSTICPVAVGVGAACMVASRPRRGAACLAVGFVALAVVVVRFVRIAPPVATTFEAPITQLAYALAPWSPLVPFALVRRPRSPAQLAACASAVAALVVHTMHTGTDAGTFTGAPFVAAAIAALTRELDDTEQTSSLLAAAVFTIGALVVRDVGIAPERMLLGLGVHFEKAADIPALTAGAREMRYAMWIVLVGAVAALLVSRAMLGIRSVRFARGALLLSAGVAAGLVVRAHTWPALIVALSPSTAFDAYAERKRAGDVLASLGVSGAPADALVLRDAESAGRWLSEEHDGARYLALHSRDLARVNAAYRMTRHRNVPIVAGAKNAIVLAVSPLDGDEKSDSPLDEIVREGAPAGMHPVGATLGDGAVDVISWEATGGGRKQRVRIALRVHGEAPLRAYCTFIHIDHVPTRFSAEHKEHAYPFGLWHDGDVIVDEFDVALPAQFGAGSYPITWGAGLLPCEDDRRMHVTSGPRDANDRVPLGHLEVR